MFGIGIASCGFGIVEDGGDGGVVDALEVCDGGLVDCGRFAERGRRLWRKMLS